MAVDWEQSRLGREAPRATPNAIFQFDGSVVRKMDFTDILEIFSVISVNIIGPFSSIQAFR
jgi:hypothetical protein